MPNPLLELLLIPYNLLLIFLMGGGGCIYFIF